jgi:hypothetical protein
MMRGDCVPDPKPDEKSKYAAPPEEWPRKPTSSSSTLTLYSVEARFAYPTPTTVAGQTFDNRWARVQFQSAATGVPLRDWDLAARATGLLGYPAAQALRWWFIAQAAAECKELCLETRLVKHRVSLSWSSEGTGVVGLVDGRGSFMSEEPK